VDVGLVPGTSRVKIKIGQDLHAVDGIFLTLVWAHE
jgi:hypothetical protein